MLSSPSNKFSPNFYFSGWHKKGIEKYSSPAGGYPQIDPIIYKDSTPARGCLYIQKSSFPGVTLGNEGSRNHTNQECIGVQVVNRRLTMTADIWTLPYRFFTDRSESKFPERDSEHSEESIFVFFRNMSSNRKMSKLFLINFAGINGIYTAGRLTIFLKNMRRAYAIRPYQNRQISSS